MFKLHIMPLKAGDCFILDLSGERYIIDGGGRKDIVKIFINNHVNQNLTVRALICTHSDRDHANGVKFLLQNYPGMINEVWLPATWCLLISRIMQEPPCSDLKELQEVAPLDRIDMRVPDPPRLMTADTRYQGFEFNTRTTTMIMSYLCALQSFFEREPRVSYKVRLIANTLTREAEIIQAAITRGVTIRWFQYGLLPDPNQYAHQSLQPVNCSEFFQYADQIPILDLIALTVSNIQSLVFYAPETKSHHGVLFCADSDLRMQISLPVPRLKLVATAPHHGAASCAAAYLKICQWAGKTIYIRSGEKKAAGRCYRALRSKYCTHCDNHNSILNLLSVDLGTSSFKVDPPAPCCCI